MYSGIASDAVLSTTDLRIYYNGELIMSSLGIALVLISLYKMTRRDVQGYRLLFWGAALIGYTTLFVYGIEGSSTTRSFRVFFQTFGAITLEFCFSIVNLALSSTHAIFKMRSPKTEWAWLIYSASHIPLAMGVAALYTTYHAPGQHIYWNHVWLFTLQLINMAAFVLHLHWIRRTVRSMTMSRRTAAILVAVLSRFMDFCVSYALYMVSTFMLMILAIVDVSGGWSLGARNAIDCALYLYGSARFYTFLRAVYIFRPYWIRRLTTATLDVFHSATVRTGGAMVAPGSFAMINAPSNSSISGHSSQVVQCFGLNSVSLTLRVDEDDLKHLHDGMDAISEVLPNEHVGPPSIPTSV